MKLFSLLALTALATPAFGAATDLNCDLTVKGGVKHVHAHSKQTCEKRKGAWVVVATPTAAVVAAPIAPTVPAVAPVAPTVAPTTVAPVTAPADAPKK